MKIYVVVSESDLPCVSQYNLEEAFEDKKDAINCIACNARDIMQQLGFDEFKSFVDYKIEESEGYWNCTDANDEYYICFFIEEMELHAPHKSV